MRKIYLAAVIFCLLALGLTGCAAGGAADSAVDSAVDSAAAGAAGYDNILTVADLTGKPVGVSLGSGADMQLTGDTRFDLRRYDTGADALMGLKNSSVAAVAVEITTAREFLKNNADLSVISGNIGAENYGVVVAQGNDALKYKVDLFIDYLKESGAYENMVDRWIRTGADVITMPDFEVRPGDLLRVGIDATYTPFEYFGENQELLGFDIEFMYKLAEFYGLRLEYFDTAFSSLFVALDAGEVDLVISAVAITSDRQERYTFSEPYYSNEIVFVVKTPLVKKEIKDLSGLSGKSIAVMSGTVQDLTVTRQIPGSLLFYFNQDSTELKSLRARRIDAVAVGTYTGAQLARYNNDLSVLEEKIEYGPVVLATAADNTELLDRIDAGISALRASGRLEELRNQWFSATNSPAENPETAGITTGGSATAGTLRLGVALDQPPYAFTANTRTVGLDIDLVRLIAAQNGLGVEIVEMESGRLVSELLTGKVDLIAGGLLLPDIPDSQLSYSAPYDTAYLSLVVLRDTAGRTGGFWSAVSRSFYNNLIKEQRFMLIWYGLWQTIVISFFSILVGTLGGALLCLLKRSRRRAARLAAEGYIKIVQGIPILVLLLIVCYVIFASSTLNQTVIAVIAFSAYFAAGVAEILDTALSTVPAGQWEAATALGYTRTQAFFKHILPQAAARALPLYRSECVTMIKDTSIVGFIAILDLTKASDIIRSRTYEAFFPLILVAIIYFLIAWAMTYGLRVLEKRLDTHQRKRRVAL